MGWAWPAGRASLVNRQSWVHLREEESKGFNKKFPMCPGSHVDKMLITRTRVPKLPLIQSEDLWEDI